MLYVNPNPNSILSWCNLPPGSESAERADPDQVPSC